MGVYILGTWLGTRHARDFTSIRIAGIRSWILGPWNYGILKERGSAYQGYIYIHQRFAVKEDNVILNLPSVFFPPLPL
jgi:hypothetical protein